MKVYVVTFSDFTGSTTVSGVFSIKEEAEKEAAAARLLSDAVENAWNAKTNWLPDIELVARLAREGKSDDEISVLVHAPVAHPDHPFQAEDVEVHELELEELFEDWEPGRMPCGHFESQGGCSKDDCVFPFYFTWHVRSSYYSGGCKWDPGMKSRGVEIGRAIFTEDAPVACSRFDEWLSGRNTTARGHNRELELDDCEDFLALLPDEIMKPARSRFSEVQRLKEGFKKEVD